MIAIIAAYAAVLILLLAAESKAEGSSIHSLGDAVWYSLITLTTVGYGDISPVTPVGRVIGVLLALCSLGLITAIIGILINYISGQARPRRKLRAALNRTSSLLYLQDPFLLMTLTPPLFSAARQKTG